MHTTLTGLRSKLTLGLKRSEHFQFDLSGVFQVWVSAEEVKHVSVSCEWEHITRLSSEAQQCFK